MNNYMKCACGVAVALAAACTLYLVTPQEKIDRVGESWLRFKKDPGQACLDYERRQLKDPDSARLLGASTNDGKTTIKYKAKNGYGAYGQTEALCWFSSYGDISEELTEIAREDVRLVASNKRLDAKIACLDETNKLMRAGKSLDDAYREAGDLCPEGKPKRD